jgi:ribonuclease HIII
VFQRTKSKSISQVMFRGAFRIKNWSILSKEEEMSILKGGCRRLESTALEVLNKNGWNALKRIKN